MHSPRRHRRHSPERISVQASLLVSGAALAQKKYDPGATDKEIKLGNLVPYSGPASAYGTIGKAMTAYFEKVNAAGGVNGRRINFITADDAYNPAKSVEQTRKLVEQDKVQLIIGPLSGSEGIAVRHDLKTKSAEVVVKAYEYHPA